MLLDNAQGVIFDCDGTLLDTMSVWDDAERDLFAQIGPLTQEQEDRLHAVSIEEAARLFHEEHGAGESTEAVLEHMDTILMACYKNGPKAMPGVIAVLEYLQERGIPCVVLSSSPIRYIETGLVSSGIRPYFKAVITSDTYGLSKQDPKIYEAACEIMGSTLETTWAIDDALYANRVLAELGYHTIAPVNGRSPEIEAGLRESAEYVVRTLEDLL